MTNLSYRKLHCD